VIAARNQNATEWFLNMALKGVLLWRGGNGKVGGKPISSSKSIQCYLAEWVENLPEISGPSVPLRSE
jgi:hypothetical protein